MLQRKMFLSNNVDTTLRREICTCKARTQWQCVCMSSLLPQYVESVYCSWTNPACWGHMTDMGCCLGKTPWMRRHSRQKMYWISITHFFTGWKSCMKWENGYLNCQGVSILWSGFAFMMVSCISSILGRKLGSGKMEISWEVLIFCKFT